MNPDCIYCGQKDIVLHQCFDKAAKDRIDSLISLYKNERNRANDLERDNKNLKIQCALNKAFVLAVDKVFEII